MLILYTEQVIASQLLNKQWLMYETNGLSESRLFVLFLKPHQLCIAVLLITTDLYPSEVHKHIYY